jgi:hypothetical protein
MDITIVTPDLSHNCLGRAYVLAQLLEANHEVEIVGPQFEDEIWEPMKNKYEYKGVRTSEMSYRFVTAVPALLREISGDIVYVSKPRLNSYGVSLLKTIGNDTPLILDIDDWESGLVYSRSQMVTYLKGIPLLTKISNLL